MKVCHFKFFFCVYIYKYTSYIVQYETETRKHCFSKLCRIRDSTIIDYACVSIIHGNNCIYHVFYDFLNYL